MGAKRTLCASLNLGFFELYRGYKCVTTAFLAHCEKIVMCSHILLPSAQRVSA